MERIAFSRRAALVLAGAAVLAMSPLGAQAQDYPTKQITMVVPFAAGGTTDILARLVGESIGSQLKQVVVVENRGGAGGNLGSAAVAKSPADGYTLLVGTVGTHAINHTLYKSMPYDAQKDFQPLARIANVPNVLETNPAQPYKTVQELIAYAKADPKNVTYASSGVGTSIHMAAELFKKMADVPMEHVIYKGSAPALVDLLGNQVGIMFDNLPSSISHIRAGKLRAIAVTSKERSPALPDVPTVAEAGLPGFEATSWFGMFVPAGTPQPVVDKLSAAMKVAMEDETIRARIIELGGEPVVETPAEFAAFIKDENVKWAEVVKASGVLLD